MARRKIKFYSRASSRSRFHSLSGRQRMSRLLIGVVGESRAVLLFSLVRATTSMMSQPRDAAANAVMRPCMQRRGSVYTCGVGQRARRNECCTTHSRRSTSPRVARLNSSRKRARLVPRRIRGGATSIRRKLRALLSQHAWTDIPMTVRDGPWTRRWTLMMYLIRK